MKKLIKSFFYAFQGIYTGFKEELNFKIHTLGAILIISTGYYLQFTKTEWIAVILCIGIVTSAELFNTAIENLCNMVEPNQNPVIKKIKDMSAGAVLILATSASIIGLLIILNHLSL